MVSGNYFTMLGVPAAVGRVFNSQEDDQAYQGHPVVVLGYDYWVNRFARDPGVIGQEDPREQLPDDDRRRVGARLRRARSDAVAGDSRAHPDEAGHDAGLDVGAHGRSPRPGSSRCLDGSSPGTRSNPPGPRYRACSRRFARTRRRCRPRRSGRSSAEIGSCRASCSWSAPRWATRPFETSSRPPSSC